MLCLVEHVCMRLFVCSRLSVSWVYRAFGVCCLFDLSGVSCVSDVSVCLTVYRRVCVSACLSLGVSVCLCIFFLSVSVFLFPCVCVRM